MPVLLPPGGYDSHLLKSYLGKRTAAAVLVLPEVSPRRVIVVCGLHWRKIIRQMYNPDSRIPVAADSVEGMLTKT